MAEEVRWASSQDTEGYIKVVLQAISVATANPEATVESSAPERR